MLIQIGWKLGKQHGPKLRRSCAAGRIGGAQIVYMLHGNGRFAYEYPARMVLSLGVCAGCFVAVCLWRTHTSTWLRYLNGRWERLDWEPDCCFSNFQRKKTIYSDHGNDAGECRLLFRFPIRYSVTNYCGWRASACLCVVWRCALARGGFFTFNTSASHFLAYCQGFYCSPLWLCVVHHFTKFSTIYKPPMSK